MMNEERVKIYIDGGNTYRALFKEHTDKDGALINPIIGTGKKFNFKSFADFLANTRVLNGKSYYVGIVRDYDHTKKSVEMVASQQKFLAKLENDGFVIERGRIVYDHKIREKGVDVKIAIDIVIDAIEDNYDTAIIISSDTDLIPAIKYAQSKGKNIEYIGFSSQYSLGLMKQCDTKRVLSSVELNPFII